MMWRKQIKWTLVWIRSDRTMFAVLALHRRDELIKHKQLNVECYMLKWKDIVNNGEYYMRSETDLFNVKSYFQTGWSYNHIHHCVSIIKSSNHFILNCSTFLFIEQQHFVWIEKSVLHVHCFHCVIHCVWKRVQNYWIYIYVNLQFAVWWLCSNLITSLIWLLKMLSFRLWYATFKICSCNCVYDKSPYEFGYKCLFRLVKEW